MTRRVATMTATLALLAVGTVVPSAAQASEAPQSQSASLARTDGTTARAEAGSATETQARKGYKRCKKGRVCLFTGNKGKGAMASFRRGTTDLGEYGMNNAVHSFWNRTGKRAFIFTKKDFNGTRGILRVGEKSNTNYWWDGKTSSVKVKGRG